MDSGEAMVVSVEDLAWDHGQGFFGGPSSQIGGD